MIRLCLILALTVGCLSADCFVQAHSRDACLEYGPAVVTLTGRLVQETFPGPPNYESIRRGDRAETSWFIVLSNPICVNEADTDFDTAKENVRKVQLVLPPQAYKNYKGLLWQKIVVTGTLFGEQTGHHHTPVLLITRTLAKGK